MLQHSLYSNFPDRVSQQPNSTQRENQNKPKFLRHIKSKSTTTYNIYPNRKYNNNQIPVKKNKTATERRLHSLLTTQNRASSSTHLQLNETETYL